MRDLVGQVLATLAKKIKEADRLEEIPTGLLDEFGKLALQHQDEGKLQKLERVVSVIRQDLDLLQAQLEQLGVTSAGPNG